MKPPSEEMGRQQMNQFDAGVLWSVARIVELHDVPVVAADVLRESGVPLDLTKCDEADREYLEKVADEPYFRDRTKR